MKKLLAVGIIVLFIGASVVPSMSSDEAVYGNPLPTEYKVGIKWNAGGGSSNEIATWFEGCILKLWNSSSSYTIDNTNWIEVEIIGDTSINYNHSSGIYFSGDSNTGALCRIVHSDYIPYYDYYTIEMKPQFVSGWGAIGIIFNFLDSDNFNEIFMSWNNICHITYHQFVDGEIVGYWSVETSFSSGIHDLRLEVNNTDGICEIYVNGELEGIVDIRLPPSTVYVDDDYNESTPGWGYDHFDSIQDGVDAVNVSGTVYVYNGTYYENVVVDKTINLVGEDRNNTIIDGGGGGDVVYVSADWVNISGFTFRNSGNSHYSPYDSGIDIISDNNTLSDSMITGNTIGICLNNTKNNKIMGNTVVNTSTWGIFLPYSNNTIIFSNIIKDNGDDQHYADGVRLGSSYNNTIFYNTIISNNYNGIGLFYSCGNNTIQNNTIQNNGEYGIVLWSSGNNTISDNIVTHNGDTWGCGIYLCSTPSRNNIVCNNIVTDNLIDGISLGYSSNNNTITKNFVRKNGRDGINLYDSCNDNIIIQNTVENNGYGGYNAHYGIRLWGNSDSNLIYHNNFIDNFYNVYSYNCINTWDNGYPFGGNYWDDYTEDDLYSGPNQDIPGSDGIGDTPYNITGGDNQDLYPLMHHFEMYYMLNISAPSEVDEGELFNVVVTSIGGTVIPLAIVEFNDELKFSDSDGRTYFIAPPVETDTYYDITATKDGYTGDTETILVKDVPVEFVSTFILGRIDNLTTGGDVITFEAVNIRCVTFLPFTYNGYTSGELITISKNPKGFVGALFGVQLIFAFCGLAYQPSTSTISMNKFSQDDFANTVIWLVSGVEGNPVETKDVEMILLNESGQPQPDAEITFNEVNVEGYINPGDTFTVVAPSDGYYVFMLTHKISGATIYKGSLTHY